MLDKATKIAIFLIDLEAALRVISCWDDKPPSLLALQSQEPFCVDAMEFYQWLQWIFIPRMYAVLESKSALPEGCEIAPMAEEWAKTRALSTRELIKILKEIDSVLSNQGQ
jgi:uncharacterized protein YqcC (DUF446 family)